MFSKFVWSWIPVLPWGICHRFSLYLEFKVFSKLFDVSEEETESLLTLCRKLEKKNLLSLHWANSALKFLFHFEMKKLRLREPWPINLGSGVRIKIQEDWPQKWCFELSDYHATQNTEQPRISRQCVTMTTVHANRTEPGYDLGLDQLNITKPGIFHLENNGRIAYIP